MTRPDDPKQFGELTELGQRILYDWCCANFTWIKTTNRRHSSYVLKHIFEAAPQGFYITNGAFKGAMIKAGFTPDNPIEHNHHYNISQMSPALKGGRSC